MENTKIILNIPNSKTESLTDAEKFIEALKQLKKACNVESVNYNAFGITKFFFEDGSWAGNVRAYIDAGYIDGNRYDSTYNK